MKSLGRIRTCLLLLCGVAATSATPERGHAQEAAGSTRPAPPPTATARDGSHDFDFEVGSWRVHNARRLRPLTGSTTWVEFEGTSVASPVWNGRADLLELASETPSGRTEGLILRLYNPQARQWSVTFAAVGDGALGPPEVGEFKNGRGEFFGQGQVGGRAVYTRSVLSDITPTSYRLEQSFSDDGGETWEVYWVSQHTRLGGR